MAQGVGVTNAMKGGVFSDMEFWGEFWGSQGTRSKSPVIHVKLCYFTSISRVISPHLFLIL